MKVLKIILSCLLLAACLPGQCVKDCYVVGSSDVVLKYKCDMDPYHPDCPVRR
jgi:hypothetical protein